MGLWQSFLLIDQPVCSAIWALLVGPIVAVISFVCSLDNVPLAARVVERRVSFGAWSRSSSRI